MKNTTVLLPLIAAAALSLGACAKQDDTANTLAPGNVTLNAEGGATDANLTATDADFNSADAGTLDNGVGGFDATVTNTQ